MIPEYNKIDVENDTREVIQAKIDAMKEALANGQMTEEEYLGEKARVEAHYLGGRGERGYAFTW